MNPILIHANYFEQGQSLERACRIAAELKADGIEFRRKPGAFSGSDLNYLDLLSSALDKYPLEWVSFGAPGVDFMSATPSCHTREIETAERFFRKAAQRFPLRVVNTFTGDLCNPDKTIPGHESWHHGSAIATEAQWESAIIGFQYLGKLAAELGFKFAFETHGCYLHDTLEATNQLIRAINSPNIGILWDHTNLILFPNAPTFRKVIEETRGHLLSVHLKNFLVAPSQFPAVSSLSGGVLNIREQISRLHESGYTGPLCIESPRAGDREQFLREDFAYLRSILESDDFSRI